MQKKIILLLFLLFSYLAEAGNFDSKIEVNAKTPLPSKITPLFFGSFIEFIKNYMNGPFGMTAQELVDRGFDMEDKDGYGIAFPWKPLQIDGSEGNWLLVEGGINQNGKYLQRISRTNTEGVFGIYQHVFLTDSSANEFYVYIKGDSTIQELNLTLYDSTLNRVLFTTFLGKPDTTWNKVRIIVPYLPGENYANLALSIKGNGSVELDESSFMPQNNIFGVRNEFYKFFKDLKPGLLRYPGGSFADISAAHWQYGLGNIDNRTSPNLCFESISQRFDFGTDEFISFCRMIGAEPHLTVNFVHGTPEEAASWVEYCNGTSDSKYGSIRAANGHPEPYNVKYWEVGNEQYNDPDNMSKRYLLYYDAMKSTDSTINIMIDGNIWKGFEYFNILMNTAGDKVDIYGWHHANASIESDETTYHLNFLSGPIYYVERCLNDVFKWLCDSSYYPKVKQGSTEWWSQHALGWVNDIRSWTMETAMADALNMHVYMRNPESFVLAERTVFVESGILISRFDSISQKRQIFGGAPYYASMLMSNHSGSKSYPVDIMSPTFDVPEEKIPWSPKNVKWLDAVATSTDDTLFLSVVNRHSTDSAETLIFCNLFSENLTVKVYELSSQNYWDMNSPAEPNKITPKYNKIIFNNIYNFPPNSFTILAFPVKNTNVINDKDLENNNSFLAIPCPFDDKIIIKSNNQFFEKFDFILYDVLGNLIRKGTLKQFDYSGIIETADLKTGTYILKLISRDKEFSKLVVKVK
ncbi:MAG: T9SS type A sorting domain-containing protein [Ignavibacteriae bacterium]|nr:T9SS type A sorting domain-containing protein [Ignavibacteriota bacterium]